MSSNDFVRAVREALSLSVYTSKGITKEEKTFVIRCLTQESDANIIKFLLTGTTKYNISEKYISEYFAGLNPKFKKYVVKEIDMVLKEDDKAEKLKMMKILLGATPEGIAREVNKLKPEEINAYLKDVKETRKILSTKDLGDPELNKLMQRFWHDAETEVQKQVAVKKFLASSDKAIKIMQDFRNNPTMAQAKYLGKAVVATTKDAATGMAFKTVEKLKDLGDQTGATGIASKLGAMGGTDALAGGLGVAALTALLLYGAYKTFKKFRARNSQNCNKLSGKAKEDCLTKASQAAKMAQIKDLQNSMRACRKAKDPQKCAQVIKSKIATLSQKKK